MDHKRIFDQEMAEVKEMILKMGVMAQGLIKKAMEALRKMDRSLCEQIINEDEAVDKLELEIDEKCIQLVALRQPEASDLRFLMTCMKITNNLERIGDLAEDIAERTLEMIGKPLIKPLVDIPKMAELDEQSLNLALDAFINRDTTKAKSIWDKEKQVDKLRDAVHEELKEIMSKDPNTINQGLPLLLISRHLERVSDQITNIAEDVVYMVEAKVVRHSGKKV